MYGKIDALLVVIIIALCIIGVIAIFFTVDCIIYALHHPDAVTQCIN